MLIGGLLIAFSDAKVLALRSEPWEMVKAGAATAWNAYVALFEGAFYDPNLARQGGLARILWGNREIRVAYRAYFIRTA